MADLLQTFSLSEIVLFLVLLIIGVKEIWSALDWIKEKSRTSIDKEHEEKDEKEKLAETVEELQAGKKEIYDTFDVISKSFEKLDKQVEMLIESDKEDIKSYIVKEHHYFCYEQGWIDDYSLECMERRFAVYRQEHGNSFVEGLMNEVRALPKIAPDQDEEKRARTAKYVEEASKQ